MLQALISGLLSGGVYAVLGICVVVLYRMVGVLNVSQGAIGAFGAFVTVSLSDDGLPLVPAVVAGVLAGAALGLLAGAVMSTWFAEAGPEVRSTVAIGMLVTIVTLGYRLFGDSPRSFPDVVPDVSVHVGGVSVTGGAITAIVAAFVVAAAVWVVLQRTEVGVRLRALAERPGTAELLGIRARPMAIAVWTVMGAIAVLAVLVVAPSRTPDLLTLSMLVVPAMAAGLIGSFRSLGWTVAGGLLIGVAEGATGNVDAAAPYRQAVPLLIIVAALMWTQRGQVWDEAR